MVILLVGLNWWVAPIYIGEPFREPILMGRGTVSMRGVRGAQGQPDLLLLFLARVVRVYSVRNAPTNWRADGDT